MKNLEFQAFRLGDKTWSQLSKNGARKLKERRKYYYGLPNPLSESPNGFDLA